MQPIVTLQRAGIPATPAVAGNAPRFLGHGPASACAGRPSCHAFAPSNRRRRCENRMVSGNR